MKFYVDYSTKKVTTETGDPFFQSENLVNKITFDVTGIDVSENPFYLSVDFILPNGRKTTITTADAFGDDESVTETVDGVIYQIYNFSLTDTIMSCPGLLAFTCYINFTKTSGTTVTVKSRGVLVNGVNQVVKTTGYTSNTLLVLDSTDGATIVENVQKEIVALNAALAGKANLTGNETVDFNALTVYASKLAMDGFTFAYESANGLLHIKYNNADVMTISQDGIVKASSELDVSRILTDGIKTFTTNVLYLYNNMSPWGTISLGDSTHKYAEGYFENGHFTNAYVDDGIFTKASVTTTPSTGTDVTNKTYVDTQDASMLADSKEYADAFGKTLSMDSDTFVITLKDNNGNVLSSIDLPLETMVVNASYSSDGYIKLTLKNGNTIRFSINDLVKGLADDTKVVHLDGFENITGIKAFIEWVAFSKGIGIWNPDSKTGYAKLLNGNTSSTTIYLPNKSGTLATTDDIPSAMTDDELNEVLEVFA